MPKDFSRFDIEDFAFDESFRQWVLEADSVHRSFWEAYLADHPQQTDKILAARELVTQLRSAGARPPDADLARSIWQNVQRRTQPQRRVLWGHFPVWRVAASLVFIAGLGVLGWQWQSATSRITSRQTSNVGGDLVEEVNRSRTVLNVHLSDGSVVSLSQNSRLTYPRTFSAQQRVVYLVGEAFFEVTKNPAQPFLVYAHETVTKVLGTSFRIKAYPDAPRVTVAVRTGRVSVFAANDFEQSPTTAQLPGLVLTPNQQAVFSREAAQLSKTLVEAPVVLSSAQQRPTFEFENTPIQEVFAVLGKAYGVDIVFDAELLANRSLTVSLEDESLYDKLNVICKTVGVSYQIVDAQVIIERKADKK